MREALLTALCAVVDVLIVASATIAFLAWAFFMLALLVCVVGVI